LRLPGPDPAAVKQWLCDLLDRQSSFAQSLDLGAVRVEAEPAQLLQELLVAQLGGVRARGPVDHRVAIVLARQARLRVAGRLRQSAFAETSSLFPHVCRSISVPRS